MIVVHGSDRTKREKSVIERLDRLENVGLDKDSFWWAPEQDPAPWGEKGVPPTDNRDPEQFINALYEPMRKDFPKYIARKLHGKDQSGLYNCWRYEFTPKNYTSTIIISAGTHGNEYTTEFVLPRICENICYSDAPQWERIRRDVRVIVVPIINPWSFANNKRQNSRGVDLNRNMAHLWDRITSSSFQPGGTYYKGTAPFSEVETQYMRDLFDEFSEALAYIDMHTINTIQAEHIVFTPRNQPQFREIFNNVISRLFKPGNRVVNGTTAMPTVAMHAGVTHGMTTANPEWYNGLYGGNRDGIEMREAMNWFGNVFIQACALKHKTSLIEESHPFSKVCVYDRKTTPASSFVSSAVYNNVNHATFDMIIRRHGLLKVSGYVKFTLTAPATIGVNPIVYQKYHPEQDFSDVKDLLNNEILMDFPAGTHRVDFNARYHNFPYNVNTESTARPEQTKFRLRMKSSTGATTPVNIDSWRVYMDWEPTERGHGLEIYDFTGLEAQPEGSDWVLTYPDESKYGQDTVTEE